MFCKQNSNFETLGESVSNGKTLVASAITAKGINTDATATFEIIANNINSIKSVELQSGSNSFGCGGYGSVSTTIAFGKAFSSVPKVGIIVNSQPTKNIGMGNITTTGFSIWWGNDSKYDQTFTINWIAVVE